MDISVYIYTYLQDPIQGRGITKTLVVMYDADISLDNWSIMYQVKQNRPLHHATACSELQDPRH